MTVNKTTNKSSSTTQIKPDSKPLTEKPATRNHPAGALECLMQAVRIVPFKYFGWGWISRKRFKISRVGSELPSVGEPATSPIIGHDLHVYNMQNWLANKLCLAEIHTHAHRWDYMVWRVLWLAVSPGVWVAVNVSVSRCTALPRTNNSILQLTWLLIVLRVYKIYYSNIEFPIIREVYRSPESRSE